MGDSLAEGMAVDREERFSELLEERTGIEHINFGTTGGFSSIQEWLLYEHLAKEFDHSHVYILFVPFNDFAENRLGTYPEDSYRPYLRRKPDGYEVFYTVSYEDRRRFDTLTLAEVTANHLFNNLYTANGVRWAARRVQKAFLGPRPVRPSETALASYDRYTPEDLRVLFHSYDQIVRLAPDKEIYIFSAPFDGGDFIKVKQEAYDFPLVDALRGYASRHANVHYVDLLEAFVEYAEENDLHYRQFEVGPCDSHWGEVGNRAAADAIYDAVWSDPRPRS